MQDIFVSTNDLDDLVLENVMKIHGGNWKEKKNHRIKMTRNTMEAKKMVLKRKGKLAKDVNHSKQGNLQIEYRTLL